MKLESEESVARRICNLMHAERKAKKISQQKLCENLGITQGLLSKIENEKLKPSVYVWLTFCRLFGLDSEIAMSESQFKKRMSSLKKHLA
ncbi:MAG: helix-turn-helix transcriptional regulator [Bdellovibrionia bacterium]